MRLMLKYSVPAEGGNSADKDGKLRRVVADLVKETKPEAAYFMLVDGKRGGMIFFEESDQARLIKINEPLLAELGASIEIVPVLSFEDLKRGLV